MHPLNYINQIVVLGVDLNNPFVKVAFPILAIVAVIVLSKVRFHMSLRVDLMLRKPAAGQLFLWLAIAVSWMLITDYFMNWRGAWNFEPWRNQPLYVSILRVVAVGILGPTAEELIFRGYLFNRLKRLKILNDWLIIIILAAVWACLHYTYSIPVISIIFIEGIFLGAALLRSRSLVVPILMHICWNLYAIW
jgi:membrane protease YdiL (CAAX protease family)